ncbi:MAG: urea amidolyase [Planctomycetota bacterium]|jgi:urea carboxylase
MRHRLRRTARAAGHDLQRAPAHARLLAADGARIVDATLDPQLSIDPAPAVAPALAARCRELAAPFLAPGSGVLLAVPTEPESDPLVVDVVPMPGPGVIVRVHAGAAGRIQIASGSGLRVRPGDAVQAGDLLAEVHADSLAVARAAVAAIALHGVDHDQARLLILLSDPRVAAGRAAPAMRRAPLPAPDLLVLAPGMQTTVQAWPGRIGLWEVGVPPSGPMDDLSLRLANRCVGNPETAAGLEIVMQGPRLRAGRDLVIALAGARCDATVDGRHVAFHQPVALPAGAELRLGGMGGAGVRCALAVRGGLDVPTILGSAATFTLGGFGGHRGRALLAGDALAVGAEPAAPAAAIPAADRPRIGHAWSIGVLEGPHTDPEFLTAAGRTAMYSATWTVSPQSSRTGVRLVGPKPLWARSDGGEAGLHPSNIHDTAYAFAAVDLTGDTPIILGPDGPSTGGFVCPCVVVQGERWKLGQLRAGDTVRLVPVAPAEAARLRREPGSPAPARKRSDPVLHRGLAGDGSTELCVRRAGDDFLLVEYGPMRLDLEIRLRVHALHQAVRARTLPGVIDLVPAVRSLQVHYDPDRLGEDALIDTLRGIDRDMGLPPAAVPSRTVHLPLSWDDPSTRKAIEIYMRTVNPDAPWCPWNIEFIRRINGLASVQAVQDLVFAAEYLVLGLGDVYLGAPVAVPVDPRHRLVTTKYNPARTWTPENAVGIGGAYMCIYGMEGPGGYQFVGRTVPVWAPWRQEGAFAKGTPWLLRPFDRIRFFPVTAGELERLRADAPRCHDAIRVEEGEFRLDAYRRLLTDQAAGIAAFTATRDAAYAAERQRWKR